MCSPSLLARLLARLARPVAGSICALALACQAASAQASAPAPARARKVAVLVHDGVALLDFAGPLEVLAHAGQMHRIDGRPAFEAFTVAPGPGPVQPQGGPRFLPDRTLFEPLEADILVIPGGADEPLMSDERVMGRLAELARGAELLLSVCNGAFVLGELGLLDGIACTSSSPEALARRFPAARVVGGQRFVDGGSVITTANPATGIDGALRVVERCLGAQAAVDVAGHMDFPWSPAAEALPGHAAAARGVHSVPDMPQWERLYLAAIEEARDEGTPEDALRWLRRSFEQGCAKPSAALHEPALASLRSDPTLRAELRALLATHARESEIELVSPEEPGRRLDLELELLEADTDARLGERRVYLYQTDDAGDYAPEVQQAGGGSDNPRLFGFVLTDPEGRARLRTVLPGAYRGTQNPRHVHVHVARDGGTEYGTGIYFDTEPRPDRELLDDAARGRVVIVPLVEQGGSLHARATIRVPR